jgi:hypothetical protein
MIKLDIISIACLTGFFGDIFLQIRVKYLGGDGGLKKYFAQHGRAEAICIATGMMAVLQMFYLYVLCLPLNYVYLAIYGVVVDIFFRTTMVFSSLDEYYKVLDYPFTTTIGGALPAILPYFIYNMLYNKPI